MLKLVWFKKEKDKKFYYNKHRHIVLNLLQQKPEYNHDKQDLVYQFNVNGVVLFTHPVKLQWGGAPNSHCNMNLSFRVPFIISFKSSRKPTKWTFSFFFLWNPTKTGPDTPKHKLDFFFSEFNTQEKHTKQTSRIGILWS